MPELCRVRMEDIDNVIEFIRNTVNASGSDGVVLGLSGGLDSVTVTKLCIEALGPEKVLTLFMPSVTTPPEDYTSTLELSKEWGVEYKVVDVQPAVNIFTGMLFTSVEAPLEKGNISARCRMIVLYNRAKKLNYLVVGTSNRSEFMMGYFTKFGDGAADFFPIIDFYKTQVWQLAEIIGVPKEVIDRVPTAGLWDGQTDEDEMGITYCNLDIVLNEMARGSEDEDISKIVDVSREKIAEIRERVSAMGHKRMPALRPKLDLNN